VGAAGEPAVVLGPSDRYRSHAVAMFVTVEVAALGPRQADGEPIEDFWSPWADLIDTVYADRALGRKESGVDATVEVGKWTLAPWLFEQHFPRGPTTATAGRSASDGGAPDVRAA
jgi:hypothetical protein